MIKFIIKKAGYAVMCMSGLEEGVWKRAIAI